MVKTKIRITAGEISDLADPKTLNFLGFSRFKVHPTILSIACENRPELQEVSVTKPNSSAAIANNEIYLVGDILRRNGLYLSNVSPAFHVREKMPSEESGLFESSLILTGNLYEDKK
jgi:hypothetical protein